MPHRSRTETAGIPVLSWDYAYLGSRIGYGIGGTEDGPSEEECEADGQSPVLVMADGCSKGIYAALHPHKGCNFEGIEALTELWRRTPDGLGYNRVIFRSDNEPALKAFLDRLREAWPGEVVPEGASRGDPQSNGAAEAAVGVTKGLVRTLKIALQTRVNTAIPAEHPITAWMVRHAVASYSGTT